MDGVLLDSEPVHFAALNTVLAQEQRRITAVENEEFLGWTTEATFQVLVSRLGLRQSLASYTATYDAAVLESLRAPQKPSPGVADLIRGLRERGLPLGLASSSRRTWIEAALSSLGLSGCFRVLVSGDDVRRGKPEPEIYLLAATRLGVKPEHCVVIEDSPNGIRSARRAGMRVLAVRTSSTAHLPLDEADRIVDSLTQVNPTLLEQMAA